MKFNYLNYLIPICFLLFLYSACKKKDSPNSGNEKPVVVAKVSSLNSYSGRNRVKLTWKLPASVDIVKCRVYWNEGKDSMETAVLKEMNSLDAIVSNLEEGEYTFSVAALDSKGFASEKVSIKSRAYGENYEDALNNREIKNFVFNEADKTVLVNWNSTSTGMIGMEVKYTDAGSVLQIISVAQFSSSVTLTNFKSGNSFQYRTLFKPLSSAIDTFYTSYESVGVNADPVESGDEGTYASMVTLQADGPGDTYKLLGSILGGSPEETPDCRHPEFGPHITEEFDTQLNKNAFAFFAHVTPDDDRCGATDRQRTEIKTYGSSPATVKAFNGNEMIFKWKFRLAAGFKPSSGFTHIHQIKAGDGTNDSSPLITITPRYGSPNKLEIIHTGNTSSTSLGKVKIVDLAPFEGTWVEAIEKMKFGTNGTYELVLKRVSDGVVLLSYSSSNMDLWRTAATFIRPKWGIYRSLSDAGRLRDEKVLFTDFSIGKK